MCLGNLFEWNEIHVELFPGENGKLNVVFPYAEVLPIHDIKFISPYDISTPSYSIFHDEWLLILGREFCIQTGGEKPSPAELPIFSEC